MTDTDPSHRGHLATEQRLPSSAAIDAMSTEQTLRLINSQDVDVALAVRQAIPALTRLTERVVEGMQAGGRLIYVGAGTSGRLGVLDASECPPTFFSDPDRVVGVIAGGDSALRRSSEGKEDEPEAGALEIERLGVVKDDLVVGIAAGGTTPFVWGALAAAKARGADTGMICCVPIKTLKTRPRAKVVKPNEPMELPPPPSLPAPLDYPVELLVGAEVVTGSTRMKAGTATKLALNMITTTAMTRQGKTWGNLMVDLRATNAKLRDRALRILTGQTDLDRAAAGQTLDAADGRTKLALVMARRQVGAAEAQALIDQAQGRLRPLLGPPR